MRRAAFTAAIATSAAALLTFGAVHALWLVPIWSRLLGGVPFTLAGALALAWAFAELALVDRLPRHRAVAGLYFGLGAWLAMLPATAVGVVFRVTGLRQNYPDVTAGTELVAAGLTGLVIGLIIRRGWRPTLALTVAASVLLAVQAGPVAVTSSRRAAVFFVLLAGIYIVCGIVQSTFTDVLLTRQVRAVRTSDDSTEAGSHREA